MGPKSVILFQILLTTVLLFNKMGEAKFSLSKLAKAVKEPEIDVVKIMGKICEKKLTKSTLDDCIKPNLVAPNTLDSVAKSINSTYTGVADFERDFCSKSTETQKQLVANVMKLDRNILDKKKAQTCLMGKRTLIM